jgi:hypothetical protein
VKAGTLSKTPIAGKGQSYTTATVHYARPADGGRLVNACGMSRRQIAYLFRVDTPVTCKRCLGLPDAPAA